METNKGEETSLIQLNLLDKLITSIHNADDTETICLDMIEGCVLGIVKKSLQYGPNEEITKASELVAELAKVEKCRLHCVEDGIVPLLVNKIVSEDITTAMQVCRALGNICYEYDEGRCLVMKSGGLSQLLALLKKAMTLSESAESQQLRVVATGFMLNMLNSLENDKICSVDEILIDTLCLYLEKYGSQEDIPTHILLCLTCLADFDFTRNLIVSQNITPLLIRIIKVNKSPEVTETCLELILNLAETESVKTQFAEGGLCDAVIIAVTGYVSDPVDELIRHIIKIAADLIVLILVGDDSMVHVYGNGDGLAYNELVKWLSSNITELQIAGSLAMGNFARNDKHCVEMVKSGVAKLLLQILSSHTAAEGDIRLQHAALSALRNLSIAKQNKAIIIEQGAVNVLLPMILEVETFPVVFKLLATLRLLVDGETDSAIQLGRSEKFVKRAVTWSGTVEHSGIQGEASRILAWIIKNCRGDAETLELFVKDGALKPLITMLGSEHDVMVSEASLALALISARSDLRSPIVEFLKTSSFTERLIHLLGNRTLPPEVMGNIFSCLIAISCDGDALKLMENTEVEDLVRKYVASCDNEEVRSVANRLLHCELSDR